MADLDLDTLDPGIRRTVAWLRSLGFDTTDSGDGVAKPTGGDECAEATPHVYMRIEYRMLFSSVERLMGNVEHVLGVKVVPHGHEGGVWLQATYDPGDGSTVMSLHGVDDSMLPPKLRAHPSHKFGTPTAEEPMAEGCGACACLPGDDEADLPCEPPLGLAGPRPTG
jgi:hypothetical protein